jgi:putative GTP pyrophosphokinase
MITKVSGYKARHFIVSFNEDRLRLFEYRQFKALRFEIQLCTILEHAWNEIEHDRGYKGDLPTELHREFLILAKNLHTLDKKFQRITTRSIRYQRSLSHKKLESIPITAPSLTWYLQRHYGDIPRLKAGFGPNLDKLIIRRLRSAGLKSLANLHSLIPPKFKEIYKKVRKPNEGTTFFRLLTHILVIYKFDLYFKKIWIREGRTWIDTHDYLVFRKFRLLWLSRSVTTHYTSI